MRCTALSLLALTFLTNAAPFNPQDGSLQRHRRRAVDYPVEDRRKENVAARRRKRDVSYSVVQVEGTSSPTFAPVTVLETVTASASAAPEPTDMTTALPPTLYLTSTSPAAVPSSTENPSSIAPALLAATPISVDPATVIKTLIMTTTASPSTSSVHFYDNGLWHTYYPVKNFSPSSEVATSTPTSAVVASTPTIAVANLVEPSALPFVAATAIPAGSMHRRHGRTLTGDAAAPALEERKAPANLELASWDITETEAHGVRRFMI